MIEITLEGVNTLLTIDKTLFKRVPYTTQTKNKLEELGEIIRKQTNGIKMTSLLRIRVEIYTNCIGKPDAMNVGHLILNAGNGIAWDDSKFWHIEIERFLLPKGQAEYTKCFISEYTKEVEASALKGTSENLSQ